MSSTPTSGSSTDLERKLPEKVGVQEQVPANHEYERFLVLHEQFAGDAHKKLLRKRKFRASLINI
jgi:hypothetical protein